MLDEIVLHENGVCDEYCMYCYNELPDEMPLDKFMEGQDV